MSRVILEGRRLKKYFPVTRGVVFTSIVAHVRAVDGIDFAVNAGETFGLVGESGCGKTTTSKLILLLEKPSGGELLFEGSSTVSLKGEGLRRYQRCVQAVFQDPFSSLNPRMRVGDIVAEAVVAKNMLPREAIRERVAQVLDQVGLSKASVSCYPHEFSGGQRQRIAIARALAPQPNCVVLDEPVSALDVSVRAQVLNLLLELQQQTGLAYVFIGHDLAAVRHVSTTIGVMYLGRLMEIAGSDELHARPLHPYTQALLSAALPTHPHTHRQEIILRGDVPSPLHPPAGCRFHPRCFRCMDICSEREPELVDVSAGHKVACHLYAG